MFSHDLVADFKMNVMTIDDLIPVAFTEETQREKVWNHRSVIC